MVNTATAEVLAGGGIVTNDDDGTGAAEVDPPGAGNVTELMGVVDVRAVSLILEDTVVGSELRAAHGDSSERAATACVGHGPLDGNCRGASHADFAAVSFAAAEATATTSFAAAANLDTASTTASGT